MLENELNRRGFLSLGKKALLSASFFYSGDFSVMAKELNKIHKQPLISPTTLWIKRNNSREEINIPFKTADGSYIVPAIKQLSWVFRDNKYNKTIWIKPQLFEILSWTQFGLSSMFNRPLKIILTSGFRTKKYNNSIEGAAPNSFHTRGEAADIVIPGVKPDMVATMARFYGAGGIGFYKSFTHFDIGKKREWRGKLK